MTLLQAALRHPGRAVAWLAVAVALVLAVGGLFGLRTLLKKPKGETGRVAVITVSMEPAVFRRVDRTLPVTGTVSAWDELNVGSEANGLRVEEIYVEEGDQVRRGQVMARLNSRVLEAQLRQLQARLAQSRAAVSKAIQPNRPQDIAGLESAWSQARAVVDQEQANLLQARANLANAEINARRYSASLSEGFVTAQEAENRQTELERQEALVRAAGQRVESARFAAEQARQRLDLARAGGRAEDVTIAQSGATEIQALIDQVEAQIAQTRIVAPDDSLVLKRQVHLGEIASVGKVLFTLARKDRLELRAQVPEADLQGVREGMPATLAFEGHDVEGKVWQVSPQVDPTTRLGTVRIRVPATAGLKPGMFVRGALHLGAREVLTVPSKAVLGEAGRYHVYLLDGETVHRNPVTVGIRQGDRVEIAEGLKPDQRVVVEGAGFVNDGDMVQVQ